MAKPRQYETFSPFTPWTQQHAALPETPQLQGLSQAQKALLVELYTRTCKNEADAYIQQFYPTATHGVSWWTGGEDADNPRSHAASRSRTLRRLEARGLVVRLNHVSGTESERTSWTRLTEAGRTLAAQLSADNG